jgi:hypothetical protein
VDARRQQTTVDGADGEVAWSWRPGADAKHKDIDASLRDGGKKAGPRGDRV